MAYIGNTPANIFTSLETQTITGDGSTEYTLTHAVSSGKDILVYINNVKQEEGSGKSYTATGTTITFSDAVASGDACYLLYVNRAIATHTPADASVDADAIAGSAVVAGKIASSAVTTAKIAADAITGAKIADDAIDSEHYTDGSIDTAHLANNSVGITQLNVSDGSSGQFLRTDGSGTLSFASVASLAGIDDQSSSNDDQLTITDTAVVINEDSDDVDFRVESNGEANMLFVDGGNNRVGIGTTGASGETLTVTASGAEATVRVNGASSQDASLKLQGNNTATNTFKFTSESDDTGLTIKKWNGSAYETHISSDANGHVLMPKQPAFFAHANTGQENIAVNSETQITLGTERFDQNGDFSSNTFTAPVTGKYQFNVNIRTNNVDTGANYYIIYLNTSNKKYFSIMDPTQHNSDLDFFVFNIAVLADMDANDTANVTFLQVSGSQQTDIDGGSGDTPSNFSGYLVA